MGVCDYIDESGKALFLIYIYFSEVYYENQKSKCKACRTFKGINCFGKKKMDDALPICSAARIDECCN